MTRPHYAIDPFVARALCCAMSMAATTVAEGAETERRSYNLPQGDAARTLNLFAETSGKQIFFMMDKVRGAKTNAVAGSLLPQEAIDRMLSGTVLMAVMDQATGAFVISRKPTSNAAESGKEGERSQEPKPNATSMKPPTLVRRVLAIVSAFVAPWTSAPAAETAGSDASSAAQITVLSPFTVTSQRDTGYRATNSISATRMDSPIKDLPLSLHVVTAEFLSDLQAASIQQGLQYATGVVRSGNTSFNGFNLRGFGTDYLARDGWRVWRNPPTETIERIEVIKGPSAILYGNQISAGGAINFVTKRPQEQRGTDLTLVASSFGNVLGILDTTGRIDERGHVLYRLVAAHKAGDNWFDLERLDDFVIAPAVTWRPNARLEMNVRYEFSRKKRINAAHSGMAYWFGQDGQGQPSWDTIFFSNRPGAVGIHPNSWREMNPDGPGSLVDSKIKNGSFNFVYLAADFLTVRGSLNYVDDDLFRIYSNSLDTEATSPFGAKPGDPNFNIISGRNGAGLTRTSNHLHNYDNYQGQLELLWKFGLAGTKHSLITGVEHTEGGFRGHGYNPDQNLKYTFDLATRSYAGTIPGKSDYTQPFQFAYNWGHGHAAYAVHQMRALEGRLVTLGGVRYDRGGGSNRGTPITNHDHLVSPQFGVVGKLTETFSVFAGYSELNRSNGQINGIDAPPQEFGGFETGLRFESPGSAFSGTLTYFDITRANIRSFSDQPPYPATLSGKQQVQGWEAEVFWNIGSRLQLVANATALKSEIKTHTSLPVLVGLPRPNTPERQGSLFAKYRVNAVKGLSIFGGVSYVGGGRLQYNAEGFGSGLSRNYVLGSYALVDAGLRYETTWVGRRTTLGLNVRNIADEYYVINTNAAGEPREFVFSVTSRF